MGIRKATILKHDLEVPCLSLEKSGLATQIYTPEQSGRDYLGCGSFDQSFAKGCLQMLESGSKDELSAQWSDTDTQCVKLGQGELIDCEGKRHVFIASERNFG